MTSQPEQLQYTYYTISREVKAIRQQKPRTKCVGKTSSRPFSHKLKLSISLDQYPKVLYSLLLLYDKLRAIEI